MLPLLIETGMVRRRKEEGGRRKEEGGRRKELEGIRSV
jgi:hypothetical protein